MRWYHPTSTRTENVTVSNWKTTMHRENISPNVCTNIRELNVSAKIAANL